MLGDAVHDALAKIGITPERVEKWLGTPCGCEARRLKWNAIHAWAVRILKGKTAQAEEHLNDVMGPDEPEGER